MRGITVKGLAGTNGQVLTAGDATGDITEMTMRRIQIREAIKAHLDKEQALFTQGVKVLSLFFIDELVKYRDYSQPYEKGVYARIFEEEYESLKAEILAALPDDTNFPTLPCVKGGIILMCL